MCGMKIIYIANARIPTNKANGFQIMKMCEAFSGVGIKVELLAPRRFNPIKENPFEYYGMKEIFAVKKIPVIDLIPLEKIFGRLSNFIESLSFATFSFVKLQRESASNPHRSALDTIIYTRDQFSGWLLSFLNKKFVYEIHSFPRRFWLYKRIWRRAHKIIAITEGLKNLIVKNGIDADKILVA